MDIFKLKKGKYIAPSTYAIMLNYVLSPICASSGLTTNDYQVDEEIEF